MLFDVYDASAYQEFRIDHAAAAQAGFIGGIFRSSIGTLADGTFKYNVDRVLALEPTNVSPITPDKAGAYHFFYLHRPFRAQMEAWWGQIEPYWGALELLSWFDLEKRSVIQVPNFSQKQVEDAVMACNNRFVELAGRTWDGIYTSASAWQYLLGNRLSGAHAWELGVAHYTTRPAPFMPLPWRTAGKPYRWWQYTERGRVAWYRQGTRDIDLGRFNLVVTVDPPQIPGCPPPGFKLVPA